MIIMPMMLFFLPWYTGTLLNPLFKICVCRVSEQVCVCRTPSRRVNEGVCARGCACV
jgi:hypothetical protein